MTFKKVLFFFTVLLLHHDCYLFAQDNNNFFVYKNQSFINSRDSNALFFGINNTNFLKNNEYFNDFTDGYTLLGFILQPTMSYYPGKQIKIQGGMHLMKYSGRDFFTKFAPLLRVQYQPDSRFSLVMGSLYGTVFHRLPLPMFKFEWYLENQLENGVQLLFDNRVFEGDVWINWRQFILKGDPFQEKFTFGVSSRSKPISLTNKIDLTIPFYTTITHAGGQIVADTLETRVETLANFATGFKIGIPSVNGWIKRYQVEFLTYSYHDLSPNKRQVFSNGYGFYPAFSIFTDQLKLATGYWLSSGYISSRGDHLFSSVSEKKPGVFAEDRQLISVMVSWNKEINKNTRLVLSGMGYHDIDLATTDYSFGLYLLYNSSFLIKRNIDGF